MPADKIQKQGHFRFLCRLDEWCGKIVDLGVKILGNGKMNLHFVADICLV